MEKAGFIKRPKPGEDDEDLMAMQEEFLKQKNKPSVAIKRMKKKDDKEEEKIPEKEEAKAPEKKPIVTIPGIGKVNISLDMGIENGPTVLRNIMERNVGFFEIPDKCPPFVADEKKPGPLEDDGFPEAGGPKRLYHTRPKNSPWEEHLCFSLGCPERRNGHRFGSER
ncbi:hypothetical protein L596_026306 [Steinernema carpocapsae]|uniref:Uncharacterized protein n=1 Tax=Steinernema carpocapsae TaxID=34508 RepID=A0A4V5ZY49_STECR|nr:hypothetical protein L596_026306 [Steinernema carpocapsae]